MLKNCRARELVFRIRIEEIVDRGLRVTKRLGEPNRIPYALSGISPRAAKICLTVRFP